MIPHLVALIPARGGSKRVLGKNMRLLGGRPLLAYTLDHAKAVGIEDIIVSTDDEATARFALANGATRIRLNELGHNDTDPDICWIRETIRIFGLDREPRTVGVLLRPTSPFRTVRGTREALALFAEFGDVVYSVRAVRPVTEHPGKMWTWDGAGYFIRPLLPYQAKQVPWHSSPTQNLPPYYIQTSSLEVFWLANVTIYGTIHGDTVAPFFPDALNGLSIDTPADWAQAERLQASWTPTLSAVSLADVSRMPDAGHA